MPQFIIIILMLVGFMLAKCEHTSTNVSKNGKSNDSQKENAPKIVEKDSLPKKDSTKQVVI